MRGNSCVISQLLYSGFAPPAIEPVQQVAESVTDAEPASIFEPSSENLDQRSSESSDATATIEKESQDGAKAA
jgi:hypothetical protein